MRGGSASGSKYLYLITLAVVYISSFQVIPNYDGCAGYVIEFLFAALGIIPQKRVVVAISEGIQWNYTMVLNILFLILAAILIIRFIRTGGVAMLKMMSMPEHDISHQDKSH
jgi:hypothetical protein